MSISVLLGRRFSSCKLIRETSAERCGGMEGRRMRVQILT